MHSVLVMVLGINGSVLLAIFLELSRIEKRLAHLEQRPSRRKAPHR